MAIDPDEQAAAPSTRTPAWFRYIRALAGKLRAGAGADRGAPAMTQRGGDR